MPKPHWGWFAVAVIAAITGIFALNAGLGSTSGQGPPGGLLVGALALLAMWGLGKAFFNFPR